MVVETAPLHSLAPWEGFECKRLITTVGSVFLFSGILFCMDSAQTAPRDRLTRVLIAVWKVVGVSLLGMFVLAMVLMWSCAAPSDASLTRRFQHHRSELETLVRMSQEDADVTRVADSFTRVKDDWSWPRPESKWGITPERWEQYRLLFSNAGIGAGLQKDEAGNVYFIVHTEGFVTHGAEKGFVYCGRSGSPDNVFLPCAEQRAGGQRGQHDGYEGNAYRRLTDNWYIFENWD
jgi:hypothetical protein